MYTTSLRRALAPALLSLTLFAAACNSNKAGEGADATYLSGDDHKEWKAVKEYTASGDKDKIEGSEKDERMTFYRNGQFTASAASSTEQGTWTYTDASQTLSLQFNGESNTENFKVEELTKNRVTLVAGDGSKIVLKED